MIIETTFTAAPAVATDGVATAPIEPASPLSGRSKEMEIRLS
ncbi:hypothetical protein HMPREF1549_00848 [Actinomyces johnsonii F0510]|uniref:Uncharacterized protein n=1 Tax=Actinomyces johnsonii F0510 TaxID=1227262 RepID=U1QFQ6_9ACTO|nr:hypothetical protein HMPREF1549_00848 [Actinomyces johnsonii F0510]